jgi:hypothetical protein
MTERVRIQFSVWNLMLAVVPLAVAFSLASLVRGAPWWVWVVAAVIGIGPAVGALVGGSNGMGRVVAWSAVVVVYSYVFLLLALIWSCLVQAVIGSKTGPQLWSVCVPLLAIMAASAIGARKDGRMGALRGLGMGVCLVVATIVVLFVVFMAMLLMRAHGAVRE